MKTAPLLSADYGPLLGSVAAASVAVIAVGVFYLLGADKPDATAPDPTERLLSGGNQTRILAALERDRNRQFVAHDPL